MIPTLHSLFNKAVCQVHAQEGKDVAEGTTLVGDEEPHETATTADGSTVQEGDDETINEQLTHQHLSPPDRCSQQIVEPSAQVDYDETAIRIKALYRQIEVAKEQFHQGIMEAIKNTETLPDLQEKVQKLKDEAAVFWTNSRKLKDAVRPKNRNSNALYVVMALVFILVLSAWARCRSLYRNDVHRDSTGGQDWSESEHLEPGVEEPFPSPVEATSDLLNFLEIAAFCL